LITLKDFQEVLNTCYSPSCYGRWIITYIIKFRWNKTTLITCNITEIQSHSPGGSACRYIHVSPLGQLQNHPYLLVSRASKKYLQICKQSDNSSRLIDSPSTCIYCSNKSSDDIYFRFCNGDCRVDSHNYRKQNSKWISQKQRPILTIRNYK